MFCAHFMLRRSAAGSNIEFPSRESHALER